MWMICISVLPRYFGWPPWATLLTRSLPLSSPFGPTFGCSISRLPRRSIVFPLIHCAFARVFSLRSIILPCRAPCGSLIRRFQLLTLAGLLMQSFSAIASIPERLPKPPGSRESSPRAVARLKTAPLKTLLTQLAAKLIKSRTAKKIFQTMKSSVLFQDGF